MKYAADEEETSRALIVINNIQQSIVVKNLTIMLSATPSNTPQRVGRRQPFGFLTDNTLSSKSSSKDTSANVSKLGSSSGSNNSSSRLSSLSKFNNKNEPSKKNVRGILKSIVKRSRTGSFSSKRSTSSTWSIPTEEEVSESPTKKSRSTIEEKEELKLAAETVDVMVNSNNVATAAAGLLSLDTSNTEEVESIFKPSRTHHYDDEMEDMLEIKLANPVLDDSIDADDAEIIGKKGVENVDDTIVATDTKWKNIMWSNRVHEDKHGFQIHVDHEDYLNIIEKRTDTV